MSEWSEEAKIQSLKNIEKDLRSIDISLGKIANALEKMTEGKGYEALKRKASWVDSPEEKRYCPFQPSISCDASEPDECNSKCMYFEEK